MDKYIIIENCVDNGLYLIDARNFSLGVYNEKTKEFTGIRTKFFDTFLFEEYHYDFSEDFGTAKPIQFLEFVSKNEELMSYLKEKELQYKYLIE